VIVAVVAAGNVSVTSRPGPSVTVAVQDATTVDDAT